MALKYYFLRGPSIVIAADDRDPYVSWQHHLDRTDNLRGGVDVVAGIGTPVIARTAGRMIQIPNDGSAGNSCRYYHDHNPGWKDVFSHLQTYKTPRNPSGLNAFDYEEGDIVAYSGDTGGVWPHLHWHLLDPDGNRQNPWNYFTSFLSGGDVIPIEEEEEPIMEMYLKAPNGVVFHIAPGVKKDFSTAQEYADWRSIVQTYVNVTPGARNVVPPDISKVMGISWGGYNLVLTLFGVQGP